MTNKKDNPGWVLLFQTLQPASVAKAFYPGLFFPVRNEFVLFEIITSWKTQPSLLQFIHQRKPSFGDQLMTASHAPAEAILASSF